MNKRAQFYILAAVILLAITFSVFALSTRTNVFKKKDNTFEELHENYIRESAEVINNMIYEKNKAENKEINKENLEEFTSEFLKYAKTKDPSFSFAYIFTYHDEAIISNHLDEEIVFEVNNVNYTVSTDEIIEVNSSDTYTIYAFDNKYELERNQEIYLNALFNSKRRNEVRIFVQ